jgi:Uup-like ABC transporter family protein
LKKEELSKKLIEAGNDYAELEKLGKSLKAVESELAEKEDRWLELGELAE